jgi:hypothetical protein
MRSPCFSTNFAKAVDADTVSNDGQVPAPAKDVENMFQHMRRTLLAAEYLDPQNPDHVLRAFRRLFGRTGLNDREVRILQGLWSRIDWIEGERKKLSGRNEIGDILQRSRQLEGHDHQAHHNTDNKEKALIVAHGVRPGFPRCV